MVVTLLALRRRGFDDVDGVDDVDHRDEGHSRC